MSDLLQMMEPDDLQLVLECGELAAVRGFRSFLVGGAVRDLFLGLVSPDVDVLVEGDAIAVAQDFARRRNGEIQRHHAFQTATVTLKDGRRIDFATARSETYSKPGVLPEIVPGTLEDDLTRRDFTINTMALALHPDGVGEIFDPCDGEEDIRGARVRFLHEQSFSDDPTRILRALRFALRLDYEIEPRTAAGLRAAAQGEFLREVSGDRLRREFAKLLTEQPVAGPGALQEWGLLDSVFPGLEVAPASLAALADLAAADGAGELGPWMTLATLAVHLDAQERWDLVRRLELPREAQCVVIDSGEPWRLARESLEGLALEAPPSAVADVLDALSVEVVVVGAARMRESPPRDAVLRYLRQHRHLEPAMDGAAILALGCADGPAVGEVLKALRQARIDGAVTDLTSERALAERLVRESN